MGLFYQNGRSLSDVQQKATFKFDSFKNIVHVTTFVKVREIFSERSQATFPFSFPPLSRSLVLITSTSVNINSTHNESINYTGGSTQ